MRAVSLRSKGYGHGVEVAYAPNCSLLNATPRSSLPLAAARREIAVCSQKKLRGNVQTAVVAPVLGVGFSAQVPPCVLEHQRSKARAPGQRPSPMWKE